MAFRRATNQDIQAFVVLVHTFIPRLVIAHGIWAVGLPDFVLSECVNPRQGKRDEKTRITRMTPLELLSLTMKLVDLLFNSSRARRVVFVAYMATVLGATLAPLSGDAYDVVSGFDKLVHVALFAGVAFLLCWNLDSVAPRTLTAVLAVTTIFAAIIEVVQGRLWYRSGDFWDLLAGAIGALLGIMAARAVVGIWTRMSARSN